VVGQQKLHGEEHPQYSLRKMMNKTATGNALRKAQRMESTSTSRSNTVKVIVPLVELAYPLVIQHIIIYNI